MFRVPIWINQGPVDSDTVSSKLTVKLRPSAFGSSEVILGSISSDGEFCKEIIEIPVIIMIPTIIPIIIFDFK